MTIPLARPKMSLTSLKRLPSTLYSAALHKGHIVPSLHQQRILPVLDALVHQLPSHEQSMHTHSQVLSNWESLREAAVRREHLRIHNLSSLGRAWRQISFNARRIDPSLPPDALPDSYYGLSERPTAPLPPRGVYLYGDVGCGKSLLMDMTFASAEDQANAMRVHYHAFMNAVYEMMHWYDTLTWKERVEIGVFHPLDAVVKLKLKTMNASDTGGGLLCFDEFQIADVADARLMHGILTRLMHAGTVVCFTSNRAPRELNRARLMDPDFQPFLQLLEERCEEVFVQGVDYRRVLQEKDSGTRWYFKEEEEADIRQLWKRETGAEWDEVVSKVVPVAYGRELRLERVRGENVQVSTEEMLEAAVGANDFRALVNGVRTVFFTDVIPVFSADTRNLARRFITLVDVCYEEKVRLVMRMQAPKLEDMFGGREGLGVDVSLAESMQFEGDVGKGGVGAVKLGGTLFTGEDERFAFARAVSRLREMATDGFRGRKTLFW